MPTLWGTPEYRFRIPDPLQPKSKRLIELVIDVTLSAPSFNSPSSDLKTILDEIAADLPNQHASVLDFGAGKLRNSIYMLKKGLSVCGVEFEKLAGTVHGEKAYSEANSFSKFWSLVYPHEFLADAHKFDLALLINVLGIMPVPAERTVALQECHFRLKRGGLVFIYSQYGDSSYRDRCIDSARLGDGFYIGSNRKFKTFYREYSSSELDSLMLSCGFEFVRSFRVPHNHARLYRKVDSLPLGNVISLSRIRKAIPFDDTIQLPESKTPRVVTQTASVSQVRPDPPSISRERSLIEGLGRIKPGNKHARAYHMLVKAILDLLFVPQRLHNLKVEKEIFEGRKRIDLHSRVGKEGFFAELTLQYDIPAPYIAVECKNYSEDPENPEFDQLIGRFSDRKGRFGLLICREIEDTKTVLKRCKDALEDNHYILVLDDKFLVHLLECHLANDYEGIDNLLHDKLEELNM